MAKNSTIVKYKVTKTFDAALPEVYAWCTDFREDDDKIARADRTREILDKSEKSAIWISKAKDKDGGIMEGVRYVTLKPPDSWHLDAFDRQKNQTGDFHLKRLGKSKTRLDMSFKVTYKDTTNARTKKGWEDHVNEEWDFFKAEFEKDHAKN